MAKKKTSKSQAIRDFLERKPDAGPKEIVATLKKKGVEVTEGLAASVKYTRKAKSAKKATKKATKRIKRTEGTFDALIDVKKLADQYGADKVKEALAVLDKL